MCWKEVDALEFLARGASVFDVVFLDPPFRRGVDADFLEHLAARLANGARVYLESDSFFSAPPGWETFRQGRAGKVHFQLLRRSGETR